MNNSNKIITSLGLFLASGVFVLANAKPHAPPLPLPQPPHATQTPVYTVGELNAAIDLIETSDDLTPDTSNPPVGCVPTRIVFARGIQSYESDGSTWFATGPLAKLYDVDVDLSDPDETEIDIDEGSKIGTHYQSLNTPAWEFFDPYGRVIVSPSVYRLDVGVKDVKWLNVNLIDGDLPNNLNTMGYERLYRVLTHRGVAPAIVGNEGATIGSGYTTFYVFVDCPPYLP